MSSIEEEIRGVASVDCNGNSGNKRLNLMEQRDYISDLPDFVIQHILSLLPSTKQAIRTCVLSKRWKNQWAHVPVLVFKFEHFALPYKSFPIIENILSLYQCSKIMKFECSSTDKKVDQLSLISYFATERNVEELILSHHRLRKGILPNLLFDIVSLVRLHLCKYVFEPNMGVKWGHLKALKLEKCCLTDGGIRNALLGSPLLETLQLIKCRSWLNQLDIASKSLRELIICSNESPMIKIECPNLQTLKCDRCKFRGEFIENISSGCPLLESLKLRKCGLYRLRELAVSSGSLKTLSLACLVFINDKEISWKLKIYEISCPKLEKLELVGKSNFQPYVVMNLPSLVCATLGIWSSRSLVEDVLQQLKHGKELTICHTSLKVLSNTKKACLSYPLLNKSLILKLDRLDKHIDGIVWALKNFHALEELAVTLSEYRYTRPDSNENYWDSCAAVFGCLESHLRVVKIINISKQNGQCEVALNFIEFLLKHGRVLEKLVVMPQHSEADIFLRNSEADFRSEVSRNLLSFEKCSKHVVVELL